MITRTCSECKDLFYHDGISDRQVCLECQAKATTAGPDPNNSTRLDFEELVRFGIVGLDANWNDFQRLTHAFLNQSAQLEDKEATILIRLCMKTLNSFQIPLTHNTASFFMLAFFAGAAMCMTGISAAPGPGGTPFIAVCVEDRSEDDEG